MQQLLDNSTQSKIKSFSEIADLLKKIRQRGEKIVQCHGVFDLLHPGHLITLMQARNLAGPHGCVVVGLNSDESIKRLKGPSRPILPEIARAQMLIAMRYVDHVVTFHEDTPAELLAHLRPEVIVKGGDYDPKSVVGKEMALVITAPYHDTWSTSNIIEKIKGS